MHGNRRRGALAPPMFGLGGGKSPNSLPKNEYKALFGAMAHTLLIPSQRNTYILAYSALAPPPT